MIDYNGPGLELFRTLYGIGEGYRAEFDQDYMMLYLLYSSFVDITNRDPQRNNPFIPETFKAIETKTPMHVKALVGQRPIFQIKPKNPNRKLNAKLIEQIIDFYADGGFTQSVNILAPMEKMIKMKSLFGCALIETYWDYRPQVFEKHQAIKEKGVQLGTEVMLDVALNGTLNWQCWAPWMIGVDPSTEIIDEMAFIYLKQPCRKSALKRHMEWAHYDIKPNQLETSKGMGEFTLKLRSEMGYSESDDDDDMGVLIRMYLPQEHRYLEIWNGGQIIRDDKRKEKQGGLAGRRNRLTRFIATDDPYPNCFFATTPIKPAAQIQMIMNGLTGYYLDAIDRSSDQPLAYEEGAIDPDSLVTGLVSVNPERLNNRNIGDVVQTLKLGDVDPNYSQAMEMLANVYQGIVKQGDYIQGNLPKGEPETATGIRTAKEASENALDLEVYRAEVLGMQRIFTHCIDLIDQNVTEEEVRKILGADIDYLNYLRPDELPGGFTLRLRGSDIIADSDAKFERRMIKFEKFAQFIPNPTPVVKELMSEGDDFDDKIIEEAFTAQPQAQPAEGQPSMAEQLGGSQPMAQPNMNIQAAKGGPQGRMAEVA